MSDGSQKSNYYGDVPAKPSHKYSSADSAKTQSKRRKEKFELAPDGTPYHAASQTSGSRSSKKQHKAAMKDKIKDFDRQFSGQC